MLRAGVVGAVLAGEVGGSSAPGSSPPARAALEVADDPRELVVVDQFEELYTLCEDPARRDAFIDRLLALSSPVVIGVRADLYGRLSDHPELARAVADNQILLGAMGEEELERAITEPARVAGLRLEPGLVELILRDVAREPGALPLLSHALRVTWEQRDGRTLTVEGYRASGGVASAIAQTADSVVEAVPPDRQGLVRNLFLRLTELGEGIEDTRRRVAVDELVPEGASAGGGPGAARPARGGEARDPGRGDGGGRPRGADPRVADAARLARGGPRRDPPAPPSSATRPASGTRAAGRPATCIAARGSPRRWTGRSRTRRR